MKSFPKDLSISSIGSKAYGVKTKRNAEVNIAADDVVIDVKNQADKATAETYGLLVEAGSSGYERDSSISISNAKEALQKPSLILRPENFCLLHKPNFCANDCSGYF